MHVAGDIITSTVRIIFEEQLEQCGGPSCEGFAVHTDELLKLPLSPKVHVVFRFVLLFESIVHDRVPFGGFDWLFRASSGTFHGKEWKG